MSSSLRLLNTVFAAGCLGAVANSLVVHAFGKFGVNAELGVKIAPALTLAWLYPRIVWGGLWGLLFLVPLLRHSWFKRGLLFSLGPTLFQLFFVFPFQAGKGYLGMELGMWTPLLVVWFNAVWGWVAAIWIKWAR